MDYERPVLLWQRATHVITALDWRPIIEMVNALNFHLTPIN
jgi:hypothetical protein